MFCMKCVQFFVQFGYIFDIEYQLIEINDFAVIFCHKLANSNDIICFFLFVFIKNRQKEATKWWYFITYHWSVFH